MTVYFPLFPVYIKSNRMQAALGKVKEQKFLLAGDQKSLHSEVTQVEISYHFAFFLGLGQGITDCRSNKSNVPLCVLAETAAAAL